MSRARAALAGLLLAASGCGKSPDAAFTGTWKLLQEDGITKAKEETLAEVETDGARFRVTTRGEGYERVTVFDGKALHRKSVYKPATADAADGAGEPGEPADEEAEGGESLEPAPEPVQVDATPSKAELDELRFWLSPAGGKGEPGGEVAGRKALLQEAREKRPDGELSLQYWTDAEKGVVLRRVLTVFSSQVNSLVMRQSSECQSIAYGAPDHSRFTGP